MRRRTIPTQLQRRCGCICHRTHKQNSRRKRAQQKRDQVKRRRLSNRKPRRQRSLPNKGKETLSPIAKRQRIPKPRAPLSLKLNEVFVDTLFTPVFRKSHILRCEAASLAAYVFELKEYRKFGITVAPISMVVWEFEKTLKQSGGCFMSFGRRGFTLRFDLVTGCTAEILRSFRSHVPETKLEWSIIVCVIRLQPSERPIAQSTPSNTRFDTKYVRLGCISQRPPSIMRTAFLFTYFIYPNSRVWRYFG